MKAVLFLFVFFSLYLQYECKVDDDVAKLYWINSYCGCKCCKKGDEVCELPPQLTQDDVKNCSSRLSCDPDICTYVRKEKCQNFCFCNKCKDKLPKESTKCVTNNNKPTDCKCEDDKDIDCSKKHEVTEEELNNFKKVIGEMKENKHCYLPCFCSKCKEVLPRRVKDICNETASPKQHCDCPAANITCPTEEMLKNFENQKKKVQQEKYVAMMESHGDDEKAAEIFNKKMKNRIDEGAIDKMTPVEIKLMKCNLQCVCNKCKEQGQTEVLENCKKIIKKKVRGCPKCDKNATCLPQEANGGKPNCVMACLCKNCERSKEMTSNVRQTCHTVTSLMAKGDCDCKKESGENCQALKKVDSLLRRAGRKEPEKPKKGSIKQKKHKHWDEL